MKNEDASPVVSTNKSNKFITVLNDFIKEMTKLILRIVNHEKVQKFIKKPYSKITIIVLVMLLLILLLTVFVGNLHTHNRSSHFATNKLNAINNQANEVITLQQDINHLTQTIANSNNLTQGEITQLTQQVQAIQARAQQLSDQNDLKQLSQSLNDSNQMLSQKVSQLENNVDDVKHILQPHTFINPKNLPFKVISVDIWDGIPYATVQIDDQEDLMGVNESRAGWTVDSMDFASRQIVFRNNKDQYIKIQLEN